MVVSSLMLFASESSEIWHGKWSGENTNLGGHNEDKRSEKKGNHGQGLVARQMRLKAI